MYIEKIETKDLILKKATMDDVNDMYTNFWSEGETAKYMLWNPIKNLDEAKERMMKAIEYQKDKIANLVYEKQADKRLVLQV